MKNLNTKITNGRYAFIKKEVVYNIGTKADYEKDLKIDNCAVEITSANCETLKVTYNVNGGGTEEVTYYFDTLIIDGDLLISGETKFTPNDTHNLNCPGEVLTTYAEVYQQEAIVEIANRIADGEEFDSIMDDMPLYLRFGVGAFGKEIDGYTGIASVTPNAINITIDNEDLVCYVLDIARENAKECANEVANKIGYSIKEESIDFTNGSEEEQPEGGEPEGGEGQGGEEKP